MDERKVNSTVSDNKPHILDILIVIAKRSHRIMGITLAAIVLTYLYLLVNPNTYKAVARILPPQQNMTMSAQLLQGLGGTGVPGSGVSGGGGGLGGMAAGVLGLKSPSDIYVAMLQGTTIADRIIQRFNLRAVYKEKLVEDLRQTLSSKTKIAADKSGIIVIEVSDKQPERAAAMGNAFVEELDQLLRRLAQHEAKERLVFLERERNDSNKNLTKAEEDLRSFSEKNSVLQIDAQTRRALEYIAQLRAEIDAKEVQIQVLKKQATPFNFDVIRLETEAKGLMEKLRAAENQWDNTCIGDVCLPASRTPALTIEYVRLFREVKFQEGLYKLYTKMVELARLDMVRDVAVVQFVDPALKPEKRSNKRLFPALLAGMAVLSLMILGLVGREIYQNLCRSREIAARFEELWGSLRQWPEDARKLWHWIRRKK
jgi:capsule polysaccharide export protein KpsE/RkpR